MQTRYLGEYLKPQSCRFTRGIGLKDADVVEQFAERLDTAHGGSPAHQRKVFRSVGVRNDAAGQCRCGKQKASLRHNPYSADACFVSGGQK